MNRILDALAIAVIACATTFVAGSVIYALLQLEPATALTFAASFLGFIIFVWAVDRLGGS